MQIEEIQLNLKKLQDIFEGIDDEARAEFRNMEKELKKALLKKNLRDHDGMRLFLGEVNQRVIICKKILLNDRGEDRDPLADKVFRARIHERKDTLQWVLSLLDPSEIDEIGRNVKANIDKNKEFISTE